MTDHVAVLRRTREFLTQPYINDPEAVAALDHAIALDAEARKLAETAMEAAKKLDNMREQHAALVARLGELEKGYRHAAINTASRSKRSHYGYFADDLARVVAGNGGGE